MKNILFIGLLFISGWLSAQPTFIATQNGDIKVTPISHASMVWQWEDEVIYFDPTGDALSYANFKAPTIVFITDIHGDHMDLEILKSLDLTRTTVVAPEAVMQNLKGLRVGELKSMSNGMMADIMGVEVEAIPMYNLTSDRKKFHAPGRGNGYLITLAGARIYVSGDTEDIPEMRGLKQIDAAFVCMNLPYTMTEEQAASAVLDFKPKVVYPYHYRGADGVMSDPKKFKSMVQSKNMNIQVVVLNWYP